MNRTWKLVGIATLVAILGLTAVGAVAFAQEPEDGADWPFNFRDRFREAIVGALGIGVEEYDAAVEKAQGQVLEDALEEGVLTEEQAERLQDRMQEREDLGFDRGMMPRGAPGFRGREGGMKPGFGRDGFMRGPGESLITLAAEDLGIEVDELRAKLRDGETVAGLGGNVDAIVEEHLAPMVEHLEEAQANGRIPEEQVASMLEQMREGAEKRLTEPLPEEGTGPRGDWRGAPGRAPGRFRALPGQNDA